MRDLSLEPSKHGGFTQQNNFVRTFESGTLKRADTKNWSQAVRTGESISTRPSTFSRHHCKLKRLPSHFSCSQALICTQTNLDQSILLVLAFKAMRYQVFFLHIVRHKLFVKSLDRLKDLEFLRNGERGHRVVWFRCSSSTLPYFPCGSTAQFNVTPHLGDEGLQMTSYAAFTIHT
jgi:hypothetical protein